jgi:2-dehydro-3-deoxygluconokinase
MVQILAVGEVMVELAPAGEANSKKLMALGYAGDTYNTSIYLSRLGIKTAYFTRLGDDPYSIEVIECMEKEGLDTKSVETVPGRTPGLYLITNQPNGERNFTFWRGQSPAREMFASTASTSELEQRLKDAAHIYFSGITLGILGDEARRSFMRILQNFRVGGGKVVFDNNYRPQLWRDREQAQSAMNDALSVADIALLTDDDATRLWGDHTTADILKRCLAAGVAEVAIKCGPHPVQLALRPEFGSYAENYSVPVPPVIVVVDTTAAGDSFNAGYLSARLRGADPESAAAFGSRCAGLVIQHRGAIVDRSIFVTAILPQGERSQT